MTIAEGVLINLSSIVFAAGILYARVNSIEKRLDRMDTHGEAIARMQTDIDNIKKRIQ